MLLLSELLHFSLIDRDGRQATLADLAVALLDVDYPPVTHCVYRLRGGEKMVVPWSEAARLDAARRQIQLNDLSTPAAVAPEDLGPASVLLHEAVLDALIVDLQAQRVTRANDLWLEQAQGELRLRAADTTVRALARRLSGGRYRGGDPDAGCDWKYVEFLRGVPEAVQAGASYHRRVVHLPPGELARLSLSLPYLHVAELLELLPDQRAADTLESMSPERRLQVFEELQPNKAANVLAALAPDVAADLLGHLDTALAQRALNRLPRPAAERITDLLRYPDDTAGGIMTNLIVVVPRHLTVAAALRHVREQLRQPDFIYFVYVVEDEAGRQLRGVLTLRDLLLARPDERIESVMNPYVITVGPLDSAEHAARRLLDSQLVALPVVGQEHRLVGAVTIDAAIAVAAPRRWSAQAPRVFS